MDVASIHHTHGLFFPVPLSSGNGRLFVTSSWTQSFWIRKACFVFLKQVGVFHQDMATVSTKAAMGNNVDPGLINPSHY